MTTDYQQAAKELANLLGRLHRYIREDLDRGMPPLSTMLRTFNRGQLDTLCHALDLPRIFHVFTSPAKLLIERDSTGRRRAVRETKEENPLFHVAIVLLDQHRLDALRERRLCVDVGWPMADLRREISEWQNAAHRFDLRLFDDPEGHEWQWDNVAVELERWAGLLGETGNGKSHTGSGDASEWTREQFDRVAAIVDDNPDIERKNVMPTLRKQDEGGMRNETLCKILAELKRQGRWNG